MSNLKGYLVTVASKNSLDRITYAVVAESVGDAVSYVVKDWDGDLLNDFDYQVTVEEQDMVGVLLKYEWSEDY